MMLVCGGRAGNMDMGRGEGEKLEFSRGEQTENEFNVDEITIWK